MKKNLRIFLIFLPVILLSNRVGQTAVDPNAVVARADEVRAPKGSYQLEIVITNYDGNKKKGKNGYRAYVKDLDRVLVAFRSPASEKGKSLLMLAEDLWVYLPKVKKPVRIPFQQRLTGEVSNGDISRLNFAYDYNSTLLGEEKIKEQEVYVLELKAKSPNKTYNHIKYWVRKNDYMPIRAEYFTVSGKSLKTCLFKGQRKAAGRIRPMQFVFRDSLNKKKTSILIFKNMTEKKLNDKMFTKDHMKTLE